MNRNTDKTEPTELEHNLNAKAGAIWNRLLWITTRIEEGSRSARWIEAAAARAERIDVFATHRVQSSREYLCELASDNLILVPEGWLHETLQSASEAALDAETQEAYLDVQDNIAPTKIATLQTHWHTWFTGMHKTEWRDNVGFWFDGGDLCDDSAVIELRDF